MLPTEPVDSMFGFDKTLMDTPRSVSVLSDDLMASYGIETALDVAKIVPSTFTTSIFGINGNVNIRGVASDTYFRGVKRLENTQLFPSPITAMSRLDVVRGPPSPSVRSRQGRRLHQFRAEVCARASTGKYLENPTGKAVLTLGSYDKKAGSAEVGGPVTVFGKRGGYYITRMSKIPNVLRERAVQAAHPAVVVRLRDQRDVLLEFGQMYQYWGGTELAGWNRVTQELIDTGVYNAGTVSSVNMDTNGDGLISTAEVDSFGPLLRTFAPGAPAATVAARLGAGWQVDPSTVAQGEDPPQRQFAESRG